MTLYVKSSRNVSSDTLPTKLMLTFTTRNFGLMAQGFGGESEVPGFESVRQRSVLFSRREFVHDTGAEFDFPRLFLGTPWTSQSFPELNQKLPGDFPGTFSLWTLKRNPELPHYVAPIGACFFVPACPPLTAINGY